MRRLFYKYRYRYKKIIGIVLGIVGVLIIINTIPIEVLLVVIGGVLIIMGFLILK